MSDILSSWVPATRLAERADHYSVTGILPGKERCVARRRAMGELESEVLSLLWAADEPLTPGDVLELLDGDLAYTTAMTILTRLWEKGLVEREQRGRAYAYSAVVSEAELAAQRMQTTLEHTRDREGALSRFVGSLSKKDERTLRAIVDQLQRRR